MNELLRMISFGFVKQAFVVGILVSVCASLLGVSLVLKRYSMIGDGLSHVGFGAMAVASVLGFAPLKTAIPVVIISAFLLLRVSENSKLKGESAIALISSGALAIGVMVISMSSGMNTDLMNYMFGSILSISYDDAKLSAILSIIIIIAYILLYPRVFAVTFDESFARATGLKTGIYNSVIAVLTAVTVVLGMRMMGTLLISSLIIFPPLTAMCVTKTFRKTVVLSVILSVVTFSAGMILACVFGTPAGAGVVCIDICLYAIFRFMAKLKQIRHKI